YKNGLVIPEVTEDICIGCGACEYVCPSLPYKSIYVEGHVIHQKASKPEIEKLEETDTEEDFPF
ncbi:MAG: 4Fe-4S binding protein, partial [Bacteroidales bacterium]|nr:4Fe-4S binding protein [Bacteroidales bacterium]